MNPAMETAAAVTAADAGKNAVTAAIRMVGSDAETEIMEDASVQIMMIVDAEMTFDRNRDLSKGHSCSTRVLTADVTIHRKTTVIKKDVRVAAHLF